MSRLQQALVDNAVAIREIVIRNGADNPRVFGSVARGEDGPESDVDILVDGDDRLSLLKLIRIEREIKDLLGVDVDVVTLGFLNSSAQREALVQAKAL